MPRKRKYNRKRKMTRRRKPKIYMPIGGFPKSKVVKLRWCEELALDAGSNSYVIQSYIANSPSVVYMTNPTTPNTHQPANYDVWAKRYDRHVVLGSKIKIQYTPNSNGALNPAYIGCVVKGGNESQTELANLLMNGSANALEQGNTVRMRSISAGTSSYNPVMVRGFSPSKVFGQTKTAIKNDDQYRGITATGGSSAQLLASLPAERAFFHVFAATIGGNNPGQLHFLVTIDYIVKFFGIEDQSPS